MSNTSLLGAYGDNSGSALMFRNLFINGGFDIWQRGGSLGPFAQDAYVADRWRVVKNDTVNYSVTLGQFALGQTDVPDNPRYFHRLVVNSIGSAVDFVATSQRIEDVTRLGGRTVTLSFWARADQAMTINPPVGTGLGAITIIQNFGTSGSPSAQVVTNVQQSQALTTSWAKYTYTFTVPSVSGKTLGTDANSSYTQITIFPVTAGMGGRIIDISNAQIEFGPTATPFERRPIEVERQLCQRYYARGTSTTLNDIPFMMVGAFGNASVLQVMLQYPCPMRAVPTFARNGLHLANGVTGVAVASFIVNGANTTGAQLAFTAATASFGATQGGYVYSITAGHWFEINAEL